MDAAVPTPAENGKWHITIGIPSHDMCPITFAFDLANLVGYSKHVLGDTFDFSVMFVGGTYIHKARQELATEMLEAGCHYMLWVDADMRFPKDALVKLLARNVPMVGINYVTRSAPPRFVAIKTQTGFEEDGTLIRARLLETNPDSVGIEKVEAIGFGLVLIKAVVTQGLPDDKPWFFFGWSEETQKLHVGEDVWFCRLVRENGYDIYVDHDLSKECAHTGQIEYRLEHVWGIRDAIASGEIDDVD